MTSPIDRIAVGVIRKAHGVRGEASVEPWTDSPHRFEDLTSVLLVSPDSLSERVVTIEETRVHANRALLKFSGIDSPEELQNFRGWTVEIDAKDARKLESDEYFLHDLVGLRLVDGAGVDRGTVQEVIEGGGGLLLTVVKSNGRRFDVPFASSICTRIDLTGKTITVELPGGIDED